MLVAVCWALITRVKLLIQLDVINAVSAAAAANDINVWLLFLSMLLEQ